MTFGEMIWLGAVVVYLLMVGITHGYHLHLNPYDHRCTYDYSCDERYAAAVAVSVLWPIWWPSHFVQEALK